MTTPPVGAHTQETLDPSQILAKLAEYGFCMLPDESIGQRLERYKEESYPVRPMDVLDLYEEYAIKHQLVRGTLQALNGRSLFAIFKLYGAKESQPSALMRLKTSERSEHPILLVQLWEKGSRVTFYAGSCRNAFNDACEAPNGYWTVPEPAVKSANDLELSFEDGGLTMIDAHTFFKVSTGRGVILGFAAEEMVDFYGHRQQWAKMKFPNSTEIQRRVGELQGPQLAINCEFCDVGGHDHLSVADNPREDQPVKTE